MLELNRLDMARIDKERTFLLLPVAPANVHGHHLPAGTDLFLTEELAGRTAARLRDLRPDWSVLILPTLPVGAGTTNQLGGNFLHPSSLPVDPEVLRRFLDSYILGLGDFGFPNLFLLSLHADPQHHQLLGDVALLYHHNYMMRAEDISSLVLADSTWRARAAAVGQKFPGGAGGVGVEFELMGGAAETSLLLAARPGLVEPDYASLAPVPAASWDDAVNRIYELGWPGYLGSPARASADYGRALWPVLVEAHVDRIMAMVDTDERPAGPRFEDLLAESPPLRDAVRARQRFYERYAGRYQTWVKDRADKEKAAIGNRSVRP
jgi:creatinine amidohydrolase/Fe(II)-dependent formamide hydrolase-like protein